MTKENNSVLNQHYIEDAPTVKQVHELVGTVILEFGAPWCGHCQAAAPAVQEAMAEYSDLTHIKVYDGKGKRLGRAFKVTLWPTLIKLHNGQEVARIIRPLIASDIKKLIEQ